jgi:hypothetical protein
LAKVVELLLWDVHLERAADWDVVVFVTGVSF